MQTKTQKTNMYIVGLFASTALFSLFFLAHEKNMQLADTAMLARIDLQTRVNSYLSRMQVRRAELNAKDIRLVRKAQRLEKRIYKTFGERHSLSSLVKAVENREKLLQKSVTVHMQPDEQTIGEEKDWTVSVSGNPLFISFDPFDPSFDITKESVQTQLDRNSPPGLTRATHAVVTTVEDDFTGGKRAQFDQIAASGFKYDTEAFAADLLKSLTEETKDLTLTYTKEPATLTYVSDTGETKTLTLLAEGKSNFTGSVPGRSFNIRKGIAERIHGIVVDQGSEFSFVDEIGPMTASRGWRQALAIFGGVNLEPITGGGVCQIATTVYRSMLLAGLPIPVRKAHSLYVSYYSAYGVGLDATIFPGAQDLTFINDTPDVLVMQAYTDEDDNAYVNMYGVDDGRIATLEGPYFQATAPEGFTVPWKGAEREMYKSEIAWMRHVSYPDGRIVSEPILSTYNRGIPSKITTEYAGLEGFGTNILHGAPLPEPIKEEPQNVADAF